MNNLPLTRRALKYVSELLDKKYKLQFTDITDKEAKA